MPTPKQVLDALKTSPISLDVFQHPVIASDLRIYSQREYFTQLLPTGQSPVTREAFIGEPFPFAFQKLDRICSGANTISALLDIATCPVTKRIMENPRIAHLVYTDLLGDRYPFVLVCDQRALDRLPATFELVKRINWDELTAVTSQPALKAALEREAPAAPAARSLTAMWEDAFTQSQTNFPRAVREVPVAAAAPAVYRGAFFQNAAPAAQHIPEDPAPPAAGG